MKILYNLTGTFNSGGMERVITAKANAFAEMGYEVVIVTTDQRSRKPFFPLHPHIQTYDLDINYSVNNGQLLRKVLCYPFKQRRHKKRLKTLVSKLDPDIIISTYGNEIALIPHITTRAKKILEIHFCKDFRLLQNEKWIWRKINTRRSQKEAKVITLFDKFVVLTKEDKGYWGNLSNIEVIPNFISNFPSQRATLNKKTCIAVGRLTYQKGFDRLIKIWKLVNKQCPEWKLEIYGNGELRDELQMMIRESHLEKSVTIIPSTPHIDEIYQQSSILLMTSRYEGFGMVLLEAMSHGLPVISYACKCGPKDLIEEGENGFLVQEGNVEEFASKTIDLLNNPQRIDKMGENAFEMAKRYSKENVISKWVELFNTITQN